MKKLLLLFGAAIIVSCNSNQKSGSDDSTKTDSATQTSSEKPAANQSANWAYTSDTDKMTSKLNYYAQTNATNKLNFDFPYQGGSTASIIVRNVDGKNELMLDIDKGQFDCDVTDGCVVNVRFDSDPAMKLKGSEPSDGSTTVLFMDPAAKVISKMKTAKSLMVEAEFYQEGVKDMTFNVSGFTWDH